MLFQAVAVFNGRDILSHDSPDHARQSARRNENECAGRRHGDGGLDHVTDRRRPRVVRVAADQRGLRV